MIQNIYFLLFLILFSYFIENNDSKVIPKSTKHSSLLKYNSFITNAAILASPYILNNLMPMKSFASTNLQTNPIAQLEYNSNLLSKSETIIKSDGFLSGLVSGAVSRTSKELLLHPIDTIKARQQINNKNVTNINNLTIFENIQDLYSGISPALIGGIPAGSIFFAVKDYSKLKLQQKYQLSKEYSTILSVILANIPYWIIRTPWESLKTRQQVGSQINSNIELLKELYEKEGFNSLYQSLYGSYLANFGYSLPADIIKFVACKLKTNFFIFH